MTANINLRTCSGPCTTWKLKPSNSFPKLADCGRCQIGAPESWNKACSGLPWNLKVLPKSESDLFTKFIRHSSRSYNGRIVLALGSFCSLYLRTISRLETSPCLTGNLCGPCQELKGWISGNRILFCLDTQLCWKSNFSCIMCPVLYANPICLMKGIPPDIKHGSCSTACLSGQETEPGSLVRIPPVVLLKWNGLSWGCFMHTVQSQRILHVFHSPSMYSCMS